ncbi:putative disease resistance protein RGA3 [Gossypium hirsutum]|uniref:Disease resistance protein RGA3 n=1 Tax=Gossypium hirsutum TaxID=3635 RepID=A0A1U8PDG6_GOSHI|nr:putative disease resistance protein RGA3 [Gossypium hirsutum]
MSSLFVIYFKDLRSKGFVQDVDDKVTFYKFKIHDLIHDLALSVSQEECLTIYQQTISASENVRHLAFAEHYPMRILQPFLKKLKGVRTLVNLTPWGQFREVEKTFLSACISYFKYLWLIELENCTLKALPKSICTLKHLKCLVLSSFHNLRRVPKSIHKLQSLLTLRLFNLPRFQVSDNLRRLINLRFLEISGDDMQLREVRPGNWSSLRFLYFYKCTTLKCLFEGMENLTSLKDLIFEYCYELESLSRSLKFLVKLEDIFIISCPKINLLMEPQGIEDQNLHLGLKNFIIRDAPSLRDLPRLLLEASASHLEFIEIRGCPELEALPNWFQNLISLQRLEIIDCPKLSRLFDGVEHLTSLKQLKIQQCPTMNDKYRPQTGADWSKISHIQEVHIEEQKIIKSS